MTSKCQIKAPNYEIFRHEKFLNQGWKNFFSEAPLKFFNSFKKFQKFPAALKNFTYQSYQ